jgi:hypothetical protein
LLEGFQQVRLKHFTLLKKDAADTEGKFGSFAAAFVGVDLFKNYLVAGVVAFAGCSTEDFPIHFVVKVVVKEFLLAYPFKQLVLPVQRAPQAVRLVDLKYKDNVSHNKRPLCN